VPKNGRRTPPSTDPLPLPDDLRPATSNEWIPVFRRVIADPSVKNVGIWAATYSDPDGTNIFPGNQRLANVTGHSSDKTIRNALQVIRDYGLMHRLRIGAASGRRGHSDEYQLTIPVNIFERGIPMLTPEEEHPDPGRPPLHLGGGQPEHRH
jgi:hypothetical protein